MQRIITVWTTIALLGLVILWTGCSGPRTEVVPTQPVAAAETDTPTEIYTTSGESANLTVPSWFLNTPVDPNYLYSTATAKSRDLQLALDNAKHSGRLDIAGQMGTKVSGLFKRFREEIGAEEDSELMAMTTAVSKEIVSEVINGCRTAKQNVTKEGISYLAYVLMEMPIGEANTALMKKVKANKNMYTRFRASEGFKELESEVEKYENWKEEQSQ